MIKTWEIGDNGLPQGVHPLDLLNIYHEDFLDDNTRADEVDWHSKTILGYDVISRFSPDKAVGIFPPPFTYKVPIGFIWSGVGTYHEARLNGSTDDGLIRVGFLTKIPVPSAVPAEAPPAIPVIEPESLVREDLDPQSRYYDAGGIETIDVIKAKLTPEQLRGYLLGNLIKYSCRMNFKGSAVRDAEKCKYYSQWLAELEQENV